MPPQARRAVGGAGPAVRGGHLLAQRGREARLGQARAGGAGGVQAAQLREHEVAVERQRLARAGVPLARLRAPSRAALRVRTRVPTSLACA